MIKKISDELLRYIYTTLDRKKCYSIRKIIVDYLTYHKKKSEFWIAENIEKIEKKIRRKINNTSDFYNRFKSVLLPPFILSDKDPDLMIGRVCQEKIYDFIEVKIKEIEKLNWERYEHLAVTALEILFPSSSIFNTRKTQEKGIDIFGEIYFGEEPLKISFKILGQVKHDEKNISPAKIIEFFGNVNYLLKAREIKRIPSELSEFIEKIKPSDPTVLIFIALSFTKESFIEAKNLGVKLLDAELIAFILAKHEGL